MGPTDRQQQGLGKKARPARDKRRPVSPLALGFQPEARELEERPLPGGAHWALYGLVLLVIAIIVWASVSEVDRIVVARGKLVTSAPTLVVQPLETSIIREVKARVGQVVKKGQVLAALDPTFTEADVARLRGRMQSLGAQIDRLEAELAGRDYRPPADSGEDGRLQLLLHKNRRARYESRLRAAEEGEAGLKAQLQTTQRDQKILAVRLRGLREIEEMRSSMQQQKHESRLRVLEARNTRLEVERELARAASREQEIKHELARVKAEAQAFVDSWRQDAAEELVGATRERNGMAEQLAKAVKRQDLVLLKAPADSVVLEVGKRSVGSVVREAETLFTLVPLDVPLEAEVRIAARDIGYIRRGDAARLKIDAFSYQKHGTLEAEVASISEDVFQSRGQGGPEESEVFYLARLIMKTTQLQAVGPDARLIPGMSLAAELKVGRRSVISYFLYPIIRTFDESIREP